MELSNSTHIHIDDQDHIENPVIVIDEASDREDNALEHNIATFRDNVDETLEETEVHRGTKETRGDGDSLGEENDRGDNALEHNIATLRDNVDETLEETEVHRGTKETRGDGDSVGEENDNRLEGKDDHKTEEQSGNNMTGNNVENDRTVTLRRQNISLDDLSAFAEDDYKFSDFVLDSHFRSRKKTEIGSEKMISNDDLRLAATLVHDAMEGRTVDFKREPRYVRSYNLYKSWKLTNLLYVSISINMALALFEKPALPTLELPYWATMIIEAICMLYFSFRTCHHAHWRRRNRFFKDTKNIVVIGILIATTLDMIVFIILSHVYPDQHHIRYSRILRALLIVNFSDGRQIRRAWRNIRRTIKEIVHVVVLFYFFIFVFALITYRVFQPRDDIVMPDGSPYFKDYLECVWQLYILVTTANNPDIMMPAYDESRFYCILFSVYVIFCLYLLLNVILAVTYHSYRENMKEEIKNSSYEKKRKLGQAFDVIKIDRNGEDMVTYRIWKRLMRLAQPEMSKNQIDLLMLILDMNRSGHIGRREFMNVADLMNVPVSEVKDRMTWLETHFPKIYLSAPSEFVKTIVDSIFFKLAFDVIIIVNVFLIAFLVDIAMPFWILFSLEIIFKVYTYGPVIYFSHLLNWSDVIITTVSLAILIVEQFVIDPTVISTLRVIVILRIFRVLRFLEHIERFKIITDTIVNISQSIIMYGGIVFIMFYAFAIVGMEVFQGRIRFFGYGNITDPDQMYCGAPKLKGSVFYESHYCNINFNDAINAFMVLSTLLIENNWHIMAEGYVAVTNKAARLFFALFHMMICIVVMNIVTAFVVDMFMYEYTIQKNKKLESAVEAKIKELGLGIDADTGLEISSPLSDDSLRDLLDPESATQTNHTSVESERRRPRPWLEKPDTSDMIRKAEKRFSRIGAFVYNRRSEAAPTLNRFDGIRFHLKKRGWTKIEVLLQQLFEMEMDIDVTVNLSS